MPATGLACTMTTHRTMHVRARLILGSIVLAIAGGCGGAHKPVLASVDARGASPTITSRWSYHPEQPGGLLARMDLGDAKRLFAGRNGERWLVQAKEGKAEAAAMLADQDLVAISKPSDDTFAFVGNEGTIYLSKTPLGPFHEVRRLTPEPLRVAAAGNVIVALHWDGTVSRSTDAGNKFTKVDVGTTMPLGIALAPDGRAMLLGYPERLWISADNAATWSPAKVPTIGAGIVGLDATGSLIARGMRESVTWTPDSGAVPTVVDRGFEQPLLDLLTDLQPGPSATALMEGHAVLAGTTYYEVAQPDDHGPWFLAKAELTERIRWIPIHDSKDCKHMAIGVDGRRVVLGCMAGAKRGGILFPALRLLLSRDGGSTFTLRRPTVLVADEENVGLTVLGDDTIMVTGACKPEERGLCAPGAPVRLVPAHGSRSLVFESTEAADVPRIAGRASRVIVGPGGRLYSTAVLAATRRPTILVSDDAGKSFRALSLDFAKLHAPAAKNAEAMLSNTQPGKLQVGADGELSWLLYAEEGPVWVVADPSGRVLSVQLAPEEYPFVEAVGRRGIAFGGEGGKVVQSNDGGASFQPVTTLPSPSTDSAPPVWCGVGGCVFGDNFARLGWASNEGGVISGEPKNASPPKASASPAKRTPIVCELIHSAAGNIDGVVELPDAADAGRGSVAWSALIVDRATASVQVAHASASPNHGVRIVTLLPPVRTVAHVALDTRTQAEGAAALRYSFSGAPDGNVLPGSPMGQVEVAWDNQFEGPPQRATLKTTGAVRVDDVTPNKGEAARANVSMLSIASGGIHVCPHAVCNQAGDRISFVRSRGPAETIEVPPWPETGLGGKALSLSHHMMQVEGRHVPVALQNELAVLLRAGQRADGSYEFMALGLAPWTRQDLSIEQAMYWAHKPGTTALVHSFFHQQHDFARAALLRFDTNEGVAAIERAPTQRDLSDPPPACDAERTKTTFRIPSPSMADTRHPVVIEHGGGRELLHTQLAVLHGVPNDACVVTMGAEPSRGGTRRALIPVGAMDQSWLLSLTGRRLSWQGMRCRFQPGANLDGATERVPEATPTVRAGSHKRPASEADCSELFDRIMALMGHGMPAGGLAAARTNFVQSCRDKPVDMECARTAPDVPQLIQQCVEF